MPAPSAPSLMTILDLHDELDRLFLAHQTALLDRKPPEALDALDRFAALLAAHIADEDAWILPAYEAKVTIPEGGKPDFFRFEHRKLQSSLVDIRAMLTALSESNDTQGILAVLDRETAFKDLLRHHDARERTFLYPLLQAALNDEERLALIHELQCPP